MGAPRASSVFTIGSRGATSRWTFRIGITLKGRLFAVRIDITTPTREIAATRDPPTDRTHEDFNVVLRDAFDSAARQLEDEVRRRRGDVNCWCFIGARVQPLSVASPM